MKTNYKVTGWKMTKNEQTWEMERTSFVSNLLVNSILKNIETLEDREFFEQEISTQLKCDYFELNGLQYN